MESTHNISRWLAEVNTGRLAPEALNKLMQRLYPISFGRAKSKRLQDADAASVEQKVVLGIFKKLASGSIHATNRGEFFALAAKFAHDEIINRFRQNAKRPASLDGILIGDEYVPFDSPLTDWLGGKEPTEEEEDACNELERRLTASLDDEQLAVFRMRIEEDLDPKDIATRLNKSKETVYRILRSIADRLVTVSDDSEIAWLRAESSRPEAQSVCASLAELIDSIRQAVLNEWLRGDHPTDIAKSIRSTDNRTYRLLHEIDNIIYVLRRQPALDALRQQLQNASNVETRDSLLRIIKKRKWPIFESWVGGQTPLQLAESQNREVPLVYAVLREIHELSRAIRRVI